MPEPFEFNISDAGPSPKTFISYSAKENGIARQVKDILAEVGIDGFLAHEDIHISQVWKQRILEELDSAQIFIALLSEAFKASDWAPQEIGVAVGRRDVAIIPLMIDATVPFGFINHLQGKPVKDATGILPERVTEPVAKEFPRFVIARMITRLKDAKGWRHAEDLMKPLMPLISLFTEAEANAFAVAAANNGEIWNASRCHSKYVPEFLEEHGARIRDDVRNALEFQITHHKWYEQDQAVG